MPELPEVEVVRRGLERWITGRRIDHVEILHPRAVRRNEPDEFVGRLVGQRIDRVSRRGKYLWWECQDVAVIAHLGMSGQMLMQPLSAPLEKHARVVISFHEVEGEQEERQLRFVDQRTFGGLALDQLNDAGVPLSMAHIAPDPYEESFDDEHFVRRLRSGHRAVKRALLDQTLISGVGNIYADEALWRARIHPERLSDRLSAVKARELLAAIREVMSAALAEGGTSFDSLYVNVNGESGYFDRSLQAYGRRGEPCFRCGSPIRRVPFMNRSSHYCPRCQRA
jgi:formamidopyrimidine-DNA glycosylase